MRTRDGSEDPQERGEHALLTFGPRPMCSQTKMSYLLAFTRKWCRNRLHSYLTDHTWHETFEDCTPQMACVLLELPSYVTGTVGQSFPESGSDILIRHERQFDCSCFKHGSPISIQHIHEFNVQRTILPLVAAGDMLHLCRLAGEAERCDA